MEFGRFEYSHQRRSRMGWSRDDFYEAALSYFHEQSKALDRGEREDLKKDEAGIKATIQELLVEKQHLATGAPYYNIYPCIVEMTQKLPGDTPISKLDFPGIPRCHVEDTGSFQTLELRFPKGHEAAGVLLSAGNGVNGQRIVAICSWNRPNDDSGMNYKLGRGGMEITLDEQVMTIGHCYDLVPRDESALLSVVRTIACLGLLTDGDLGLLDRDLLAADRGKEPTDAALKRATARKGLGWNLGRALDAIPHTRRPHWAVRHTGPGRQVPKLRPIKGSIVKRKKLTEVPSGFEGNSDV